MSITNTFSANTKIQSSQVNQNFTDVYGRSLIMKTTPWTNILSLSSASTVGDTNIDTTSDTSATATAVLLKVEVRSSNVTNSTYIRFRKNGDAGDDTKTILVMAPPANGYFNRQVVVVPVDSGQIFTYNINANATSFDTNVWLMGYYEPPV